jgi:uncharacterized protein YjiS (DUF1127 family)
MAALAHQALTNCPALPVSSRFAAPPRPGVFARVSATLRLWLRHTQEQRQLALLGERELRDMGASSADVWREIRQPFWRTTQPY